MAHTAEVVVMGGGIVGASIAYHLRQDGVTGRVLVIERDHTYTRAATTMSMGGIRQRPMRRVRRTRPTRDIVRRGRHHRDWEVSSRRDT